MSLKLSAWLVGLTTGTIYLWRSRQRRMLKRSARTLAIATRLMNALDDTERDKFKRSARIDLKPQRFKHVLDLRRDILNKLKEGA